MEELRLVQVICLIKYCKLSNVFCVTLYFYLKRKSSMLDASGDGSNESSLAKSKIFLAILAFLNTPCFGGEKINAF